LISKPRDKALQSTMSWSSNLLIKLTYLPLVKETLPEGLRNLKEFVGHLRTKCDLKSLASKFEGIEEIRLEDTGYITFVNKE
jgi:hypothetical protein